MRRLRPLLVGIVLTSLVAAACSSDSSDTTIATERTTADRGSDNRIAGDSTQTTSSPETAPPATEAPATTSAPATTQPASTLALGTAGHSGSLGELVAVDLAARRAAGGFLDTRSGSV